ncbi:MAG: hypothetical protein H7235_07775, partial [Bdellovibrionaceae bacterium]|nr:hypothetical protein [Pseudobdellovibrionaceae bacterium]
ILAAIVGEKPTSRATMLKKIELYIKKNRLTKSDNKSLVIPDSKLKKLSKKSLFSIYELPTFVKAHSKVKW